MICTLSSQNDAALQDNARPIAASRRTDTPTVVASTACIVDREQPASAAMRTTVTPSAC
jgi:hypothetical protein